MDGILKTILVIEDDPSISEDLNFLLVEEGYNVVHAPNGLVGLDKLTTLDYPSIILLDLMMPVMDGRQFLEAQKKLDYKYQYPAIIISAVAEKALDVKASGYIKKPFDLDILLDTIRVKFQNLEDHK